MQKMARTVAKPDSRRARLERVLALARLSLAVLVGLVFLLDPVTFQGSAASVPALLLPFTLYALVAAILVAVLTRHAASVGLVLHGVDVGWVLLIGLITPRSATPFFLFYLFVIVGAAFRWGVHETVATGLSAALGLLVLTALAATRVLVSPLESDLGFVIIQSGCIVGVAALLGYLAEEQHRARLEAGAAARIFASINLSHGLRSSIDRVLRELMTVFEARRALLSVEQIGSVSRYDWELDAPDAHVSLSERPIGDHRARETSGGRVLWLRRRHAGIDVADNRGRRRAPAADVGLDLLPPLAGSALIAEFPLVEEWAARLVLIDPTAAADARARRWLAGLLPQIGLALFSVYLRSRVRSRVTAAERSRLARELHDGLLQSLIGLEMHVDVLRRRLATTAAAGAHELSGIQRRLRDEVLNVRDLMHQIRDVPVHSHDVPGRLGELVDRFHRETGIDARFICDLEDMPLAPRQARELVRIAQEALVNVRKHSGARTVVLRLAAAPGGGLLTIDDDGRGFDFEGRQNLDELDAARRGPVIIKERVRLAGGVLVLHSTPGRGARLEVTVPRRVA
jgi:signal transduction histidine kinase